MNTFSATENRKAEPEFTLAYVNEHAEKIENAWYNICIFVGKDCEEHAFKKLANSFSELIINHHSETSLEKIINTYSSTVSNILVPNAASLLSNPIEENIINPIIVSEIRDTSSPFLQGVTTILSVSLRTLFRPLVRYIGQISAELYADKVIAGKLSRLIRERPAPQNHEIPTIWQKEVRKVESIYHLKPLLDALNDIAENRFNIKEASKKKHRSITLKVIYGIESGIMKTTEKIDALALWMPGEDQNVLDYLEENDEHPDTLRPLC